jgi:hypothetical protein
MENLKTELLSCQIPNDPDKWKRPAMSEEKPYHSPEQIKAYLLKVEDKLNLPFGILSLPGKTTINGLKIPEVKRAAIYHILSTYHPCDESTRHTCTLLAPYFGVKRLMIWKYLKDAKEFNKQKDETFILYYGMVKDIAV